MTAKKFPTSFPNLSEIELLNLEKASRESNPRQKRTAKMKIKHLPRIDLGSSLFTGPSISMSRTDCKHPLGVKL